MGAQVTTTLSTLLTAQDQASPSLLQLAKSVQDLDTKAKEAAIGSENLSGGLDGINQTVSKAAAPLRLLSGALGGVGGDIAKVENEAVKLAGVIASGGPLGIALAALSVAIGAGVKIWQVYKEEAESIKNFLPSLAGTFELMAEDLRKSQENVEKLTNEIIYFGKTAKEQAIGELQNRTITQEAAIESNEKMIASIQKTASAYRQQAEEAFLLGKTGIGDSLLKDAKAADLQAEALRRGNSDAQDAIIKNYNQITLLEDLISKESVAKETTDRLAEAKRKSAEASRIQAEHEREIAAALADTEEKSKRYSATAIKREADIQETLARSEEAYEDQQAQKKASATQEAKRIQEQEALTKGLGSAWVSAAKSSVDAWTQAGVAIATNSENAGAASKEAFFASARAAITAAAGEASAKAIAAHAGIPFVGVAIGLSVAATLATIILGYLSKFEEGGIVRGGSGVIPIGAHDGERVLSARQTKAFERLVDRLDRGVVSTGSSVGGAPTIIQNIKTTFDPQAASTKKNLREIMKVTKSMQRRGW